MENFHLDNGYDTEGNHAPHCLECRKNGFDETREFVDMCNSCQNSQLNKSFRWEKNNAVENFIIDNS